MANPTTTAAAPKKDTPPEKTVVVVINNTEGLEIIQLPHRGMDAHKRVIVGDVVTLLPGLNLIDPKVLGVMRQNPAVELKFTALIPESKAPEQRQERVGKPMLVLGRELPAAAPLSTLDVPEALEMVREANEEQLKLFHHTELRGEVRAAIIRRIDDLATPDQGADTTVV